MKLRNIGSHWCGRTLSADLLVTSRCGNRRTRWKKYQLTTTFQPMKWFRDVFNAFFFFLLPVSNNGTEKKLPPTPKQQQKKQPTTKTQNKTQKPKQEVPITILVAPFAAQVLWSPKFCLSDEKWWNLPLCWMSSVPTSVEFWVLKKRLSQLSDKMPFSLESAGWPGCAGGCQ